jgi:hypothetical protein
VRTIYGLVRDKFPESVTGCLSGLVVIDSATLRFTDECSGLLIELTRGVRH